MSWVGATLAANSDPIPANWHVFDSPSGTDLHKALSEPDWQGNVRAASGADWKACAFDYFSFSVHEASAFKRVSICVMNAYAAASRSKAESDVMRLAIF